MMIALKILTIITAVFIALGFACAVLLASRDARRIGSRSASPRPDPFSAAFGDVPCTGFTFEQLDLLGPYRPTGDVLNRHLDFSRPASAPRRPATGGRSMPFGAFARRTLLPGGEQ